MAIKNHHNNSLANRIKWVRESPSKYRERKKMLFQFVRLLSSRLFCLSNSILLTIMCCVVDSNCVSLSLSLFLVCDIECWTRSASTKTIIIIIKQQQDSQNKNKNLTTIKKLVFLSLSSFSYYFLIIRIVSLIIAF